MTIDFRIREELISLTERAQEISDATDTLSRKLKRLDSKLRRPRRTIQADQVAPLLLLNRRLAEIERLLDQVRQDVKPGLLSQLDDGANPMSDFELDAEIHYILKESDPDWDDDSDNILTRRSHGVHFSKSFHQMASETDWCEHLPGLEPISVEPHCHLFHDLYDHSYGLAEPRLSFQDCARVGEVWIDVVIRQQYFLNVETGEWACAVPQSSMENMASENLE